MTQQFDPDVQGFDEPKTARPKRSKKWIYIAAGAAVVVGGASLIVPQMLDQDKYKALIKEKVYASTGYTVDWKGDIGLSLLPLPSASLNDLTLSNGKIQILSLKEADVRVALMPLLNKQVEIVSVNLVEPNVTLVTDVMGNKTWMTSTMSAKDEGEAAEKATTEGAPSQPTDIVLKELKITKGHFVMRDEKTRTDKVIEDLNATVQADSLKGPFAAKGDLSYDKKNIDFDVSAPKIEENATNYPVKAKVALPDLKVEGEYAGVIATAEPMRVDGELTVAADDLAKTVESFTGKPADLPKELNGAFQIKTKVLYDTESARLDDLKVALGDLAYSGSVAVTKLSSSAPPLTVNLIPDGKGAKSSSPLVAMLSNLSVKGAGTFADNTVDIDNGVIALGDQQIALDGTYKLASKPGQKPSINMSVKANRLNVDQLTGVVPQEKTASEGKSGGESAKKAEGIKGLSLPFDGHLNADIGSLTTGGKTYAPLKADIISRGNELFINSASVGLGTGTSVTASGSIGNLAEMSNFDITGKAETADAEAFMKAYGMQPLPIQQKIGAASVAGTFKGSLEKLGFNATVNALRFAATGQGTVATPMTEPVISALKFSVKHPMLTDGIRTFSPGFSDIPSLKGPLDLSGNVAWNKNEYTLTGLNGRLGYTTVNGDLTFVKGDTKSSAKGRLDFGDLVFDATKEGRTSSGASSSAQAGVSTSSGRWSSEAIDTAWMKSFDADLTIKAKSITQGLWKLTNANLAFDLNNGTLNVEDVSAGLFGGQAVLNGQVKSGAGAKDPVAISLNMNASNVDARQLQSALTSKQSDTLNGTISSVKVAIASNGASPNALVNALSGNGSMNGSDIIIKGIDVAKLAETAKGSFKPLERAGSLFNTFQSGQTQFDTFVTNFGIQNGVVNFSELKFDGPNAMIAGVGNVNLPRWTIDLKNTVTVKGTDIPPFDLTIRGPLDNPLQAGGNIIEGYLRDKATRKVEKLIGKELEKRFGIPLGGNEAAAPAETAPASGADGAATAAPAAEEKKATPEEEAVKALQGLFGRR